VRVSVCVCVQDADWEVTDVFDSTLAPRRAVRVHLRKRAPGV